MLFLITSKAVQGTKEEPTKSSHVRESLLRGREKKGEREGRAQGRETTERVGSPRSLHGVLLGKR
jgi:hypothetical protein